MLPEQVASVEAKDCRAPQGGEAPTLLLPALPPLLCGSFQGQHALWRRPQRSHLSLLSLAGKVWAGCAQGPRALASAFSSAEAPSTPQPPPPLMNLCSNAVDQRPQPWQALYSQLISLAVGRVPCCVRHVQCACWRFLGSVSCRLNAGACSKALRGLIKMYIVWDFLFLFLFFTITELFLMLT